jgi:hypothetical protein
VNTSQEKKDIFPFILIQMMIDSADGCILISIPLHEISPKALWKRKSLKSKKSAY